MAPKKKSNKKQENLEEPVESEEPVPNVEHVVLEPVVLEPVTTEEPVVLEPVKESINLEINEIINPLLSNDLENLLLQNVERPKSPPPRRINKRGATMGMKLGF